MARFQATILDNPWIPHKPTLRQAVFLGDDQRKESLFGGAAGGGKSESLLMAAAKYVHVPDYAALVLRRTYADLALPGAIMDRAKDWWLPLGARWADKDKTFHFPSGATITFGYLQTEKDKYRYAGAEFQCICFDELSQFSETQYTFLYSRLRKPAEGLLAEVPLTVRAGSNPGGVGGEWVKIRFVTEEYIKADRETRTDKVWLIHGRSFIPSMLKDNPHLDHESYRESLAKLDPYTRKQLEDGDWNVRPEGALFKPEWFRSFTDLGDAYHVNDRVHRYQDCWHFLIVDPAGGVSKTSDFTVIMRFAVTVNNDLLVTRVRRERIPLEEIVPAIGEECQHGLRPEFVGIESEFNFTSLTRQARRNTNLPAIRSLYTEGKTKLIRALPTLTRMESGQVFFPDWAEWLDCLKDELLVFTGSGDDEHDDQVDSLGYACQIMDQGWAGGGSGGEGLMIL